ncbi:MAG: phosphate regulon sensor histidine kinase PhoR [Steroidobacteraceae bacterium]|jgi:two-component system phosphate regulon sensor histidine kinase PhoR|nr:phosphate regulon sensor histidine kinase PhoR [Steroidobacteraceae bacterium]
MNAALGGWSYALARLAAALVAGSLLGWFVGSYWAGLAGTLAAYLAVQLHQLYRLDHWLRNRSRLDPPDPGGLWGDVVVQVVRLHRRKKFHKARVVRLFRELRRSTASMPDGVILLNDESEILWFNRKASELLGLRRKTDFGIRIENLVRQPEFSRYLAAGQYASAVVVPRKAGEDSWLSFQAVPYGDGQMLLLVRDVSRQTRLETMRKDFVANASHELRSPLTVIAGYLETLATDPAVPADLRAPLAEMRRQSERMTTIVEDLLELSRLESSDEEVAGEPLDVAGLLATLRKDVLARPQHPSEVRVAIESETRLVGDPGLLHSAFSNLVDNAAKYTPAEGSIALRWWSDANGGHFSVTDTGPGIPAEHLPRLTERFYRVDAGRARATGGSGLGLAIVKHALQRHGAELEVTSVPGRGSTFTCHFPVRRLLAAEVARRASA